MENRILGATGMSVSSIGLGTVKLGRNQQVKYPTPFDLPNDATICALLDKAKGLGINLLDTAPAYGTSQARLGQLLTQRDTWVLVSKVGEQYQDGQSYYDFSYQATIQTVQASLRTLKTSYLDVVLIHSDGNDLDILQRTDCVAALEYLKQRGDIRAHGLSGKTMAGHQQALQYLDVVMVSYSPADTSQQTILDQARLLNKGVLIKKGLNSGYQSEPQVAIRQILRQAAVSSLVVGTLNLDHLQQNVAAATCG